MSQKAPPESRSVSQDASPLDNKAFYRQALETLLQAHVPFLVGGGFALQVYTGIHRRTKDFDIFVQPEDLPQIMDVLHTAGYQTQIASSHWIAKAYDGVECIDIIFNSGNGICAVDEQWFQYAMQTMVLNMPVKLCPVEETIWQKAFIMERHRFDGADVTHLLHACARWLNWPRLLQRFGNHWPVLLSHLILFGFVYPAERAMIPSQVMRELTSRLERELDVTAPAERICRGTLLSFQQYDIDLQQRGYQDGRLSPTGNMTSEEIAEWDAMVRQEQVGQGRA